MDNLISDAILLIIPIGIPLAFYFARRAERKRASKANARWIISHRDWAGEWGRFRFRQAAEVTTPADQRGVWLFQPPRFFNNHAASSPTLPTHSGPLPRYWPESNNALPGIVPLLQGANQQAQ